VYNIGEILAKILVYDQMEQERRKKKKEEEMKKFMTEPDPDQARYPSTKEGEHAKKESKLVESDSDSDSNMDDDMKSDFIDTVQAAVGVKKDAKTRTTVRNLRIRYIYLLAK
jgi:hypothetical protein